MVIYFAWYFLKNFDDLCRRIVADIAEIIMQGVYIVCPWYLKARENKRKQSYLRASNRYLPEWVKQNDQHLYEARRTYTDKADVTARVSYPCYIVSLINRSVNNN